MDTERAVNTVVPASLPAGVDPRLKSAGGSNFRFYCQTSAFRRITCRFRLQIFMPEPHYWYSLDPCRSTDCAPHASVLTPGRPGVKLLHRSASSRSSARQQARFPDGSHCGRRAALQEFRRSWQARRHLPLVSSTLTLGCS